jgi:selenocysteine-specific elongation factor
MGARTLERCVIIGTAGHIDHGKTALVRALTGVDTDRLPEEKRRGITIDLGFAPLVLDGVGTVGIVDVPGHEDFVRSMLVGATGIDLALLVVAADEGVMPQTREHLLILELLNIPRVVVALTKSDLVDDEWLSLATGDVESLFLASGLPIPPVVPCSGRTGAGIDRLRGTLSAALSTAPPRVPNDLFRLPVDRAFSVKGTGTVVTGTVWTGELHVDAAVRILPQGAKSRARRIEQHGRPVDAARAGARAAVALTGLDLAAATRGSVVVSDDSWQPTSMFEAVVALESDIPGRVSARTQLRLHAGASEVGARIAFAASENDPDEPALARITTDAPVVLRGGDRFVLRLPAPLRTIGGGVVVDSHARRRPLTDLAPEQLRELSTSPEHRLRYIVDAESLRGVSIRDIPVRVGCTPGQVPKLIETSGARIGTHNLFGVNAVEQVMATVQRIVAEYEIRSPLSPGVPTRTLREALHANEELADISIREMENAGRLEIQGPIVRRRGWVPSPTASDLEATNRLAHDICSGGREPPSVTDLVSRYGSSVPSLLNFLERQGRIVQVEAERYYDQNAVEELISKLRAGLAPGRVYAPAQLRELLGFSRKYLIPFLEFCDRIGVTERRGEGRTLRQTPGIFA